MQIIKIKLDAFTFTGKVEEIETTIECKDNLQLQEIISVFMEKETELGLKYSDIFQKVENVEIVSVEHFHYVCTFNFYEHENYSMDIRLIGVFDSEEKVDEVKKNFSKYTVDVSKVILNKEYNFCLGSYAE